MKKTIVLLAVVLSLVLLLGSTGSNLKQKEPICQWKPKPQRQPVDEYTVIHDPERDKLVQAVNKKLDESWRPIGGISVDDGHYYQAMVRLK